MRIGITGTSGFIGSHLFTALKKSGNLIIPFQRKNQTGSFNSKALRKFVRDKDLIYHLAGVNRAPDKEIIYGNLVSTFELIQAIKETKRNLRLVFASSSQIYRSTSRMPMKESYSGAPKTLYGVVKKCAEDLIRLSGFDYVILRFTNVYGPKCRPYYNSVIATFCDRAVQGKPLILNGDGKQGRDFIYIDDVVSALLAVLNGPSGTFNVCSGNVISIRKIAQAIKQEIPQVPIEYHQETDPGGLSYCCDPTRFMKKYLWKPKTSLRKGVRETLNWFKRSS